MIRISSKSYIEKESKDSDNPCWDGYEMVGTKKKDGKEVPNCVPKGSSSESKTAQILALDNNSEESQKAVAIAQSLTRAGLIRNGPPFNQAVEVILKELDPSFNPDTESDWGSDDPPRGGYRV